MFQKICMFCQSVTEPRLQLYVKQLRELRAAQLLQQIAGVQQINAELKQLIQQMSDHTDASEQALGLHDLLLQFLVSPQVRIQIVSDNCSRSKERIRTQAAKELNDMLATTVQQNEQMRTDISRLELDRARLQERQGEFLELQNDAAVLRYLGQLILDLTRQSITVQKQVDDFQEQVEAVSNRNSDAELEHRRLEEQGYMLSEQLEELQQSFETAKLGQRDVVTKKVLETDEKVSLVRAEMEAFKKDAENSSQLQKMIEKSKDTFQTKSAELPKLASMIEELKRQNTQMAREMEAHIQLGMRQQEEIQQNNETIELLKLKGESKVDEEDLVQQVMVKFETQIGKLQEEIRSQQEKNRKLMGK